MNLKEAFRFQNKLSGLMEEILDFLSLESNVVNVQTTYLRKKVMPEAEDEVIIRETGSDFCSHINEMMSFVQYLLQQKETLCLAIRSAKAALPIDMDSEVCLNTIRQKAARVMNYMAGIRASESIIPSGGTGYRFNAEGNQVTYRCDIRKVTTINFDRNAAKKHMAALNRSADEMSVALDRALVNACVAYEAPFDVNATLQDIFEDYLEALQNS